MPARNLAHVSGVYLELARKFGKPSTRHPIVDVDLVVVVDLDGDGGVDLVGEGVDRRVESGRNRGRPCR